MKPPFLLNKEKLPLNMKLIFGLNIVNIPVGNDSLSNVSKSGIYILRCGTQGFE